MELSIPLVWVLVLMCLASVWAAGLGRMTAASEWEPKVRALGWTVADLYRECLRLRAAVDVAEDRLAAVGQAEAGPSAEARHDA